VSTPAYAWNYFHFVDPSQKAFFNVIVHEGDMFGRYRQSYMSVTGAVGSGHSFRHRIDCSFPVRGIAENEVRVPWFATPSPMSFSFTFTAEDLSIEVHVTRPTPAIAAHDGLLLDSKLHSDQFWIIDDIMSPFSGTLRLPGLTLALNGYSYSDRQWGNLPLQDRVASWDWAHLVTDNQGLVLFVIHPREQANPTCRFLTYCREQGLLRVDTRPIDLKHEPQSLAFREAGGRAGYLARLEEDLVRKRDEQFQDFEFSLRRWRSAGCFDEKPIYGVNEHVEILRR
jgi:hypothetical protein